MSLPFDNQALLDGLGQGVLVFDSANRLVMENAAARALLGGDIRLIRAEGWAAMVTLFNTRQTQPDKTIEVARSKALATERPVRFHTYRFGEYIPCWASVLRAQGGATYTMITIETPDWTAMNELLGRFSGEARAAVESTQGHAELIEQSLKRPRPNETVEQLGRRIGGFARIISTHMHRLSLLMELMDRLEDARTGKLRELVQTNRRKIRLSDFIEDFIEDLDDKRLIDPETDQQDYRSRIRTSVPDGLVIAASPSHLAYILRDLLRNAIMYSMRATPIKIVAHREEPYVQVDFIDEGYGVRSSEAERVFAPFQRARQPQIISEFGYGLSLALCKQEVEAMNGRIWFESEEGVGTTFSFKLPVWRDDATPAELPAASPDTTP